MRGAQQHPGLDTTFYPTYQPPTGEPDSPAPMQRFVATLVGILTFPARAIAETLRLLFLSPTPRIDTIHEGEEPPDGAEKT